MPRRERESKKLIEGEEVMGIGKLNELWVKLVR